MNGTAHQFSTKSRNKNTARDIEAIKRTELAKGIAGLTAPTLKDFQPRFEKSLPGRVSKQTETFYKRHFKPILAFPALALCRLDKIHPAAVEDFVQSRLKQSNGRGGTISKVTVNHNLRTLRRALKLAGEWDVITKVPKVTLLTGENQREYVITDEDIERFSKYDTEHAVRVWERGLIANVVPFLVDTGLRRGEVVHLTWAAVNLDVVPPSVEVLKGKTKSSRRRVPLTARAAGILRKQPRTGPFVFTVRKRQYPVTADWLSHAFLRARRWLGLPKDCVLHCTRHTFCTRLGERGADAFAIQRLAGHSSIVISQRYVHATGPRLDAAIGLLEPAS